MRTFHLRLFSLVGLVLLAAGCGASTSGDSLFGGNPFGNGGGGGGYFTGSIGHIGGDPSGGDGGISCPSGYHASGNTCVVDEVTCATEFPCPDGQQCVGGRCVGLPASCSTNDDCPTGYACVNGTCQPACTGNALCKTDNDCPTNQLCISCQCVDSTMCNTPTPSLSGTQFAVRQDLHLKEALSGFEVGFIDIMKDLRDGILGCPAGSGGNCGLFQLISLVLPQWSKTLIVAVGNFGDILDNDDFKVQSFMTFTPNGKPSGYNGVDRWTLVSFQYQGHLVQQKPENIPQIGQPVVSNFTASAICGVVYVDKHKIDGVLSGILRWIIDTVVQLATCSNGGPCYQDLGQAISAAIDCSQVQNIAAQILCQSFVNGLAQDLDNLIDSWVANYALLTLQGTATVTPNGKQLVNGIWDGTLGSLGGIFNNFSGTWSGSR